MATKSIARDIKNLGAKLGGGGAEALIEDRGSTFVDPAPQVELIVATPESDAEGIREIMDLIAATFTDQFEWTDRVTGQAKPGNKRWFTQQMMLGGLVRQLDFNIDLQKKRCAQAEIEVDNASDGRADERSTRAMARAERNSEQEVDKLAELRAMRRVAAAVYQEYTGKSYDKPVVTEVVVVASETTAAERKAARLARANEEA